MGKTSGFLEFERETAARRPVTERVNDWFEIYQDFPASAVKRQGARCMDCGIPFCNDGCPLHNLIPDWNDLVYQGRWREAVRALHATNNFPEFTGRVCPAPCEAACVLGINARPVAIKTVERWIIDYAFDQGWIQPEPAKTKSGKRVAVVGSGPAGLAAAQQLARSGHGVTVFEKNDRIGGLLRYGIPDFKMEKAAIDRRIAQMGEEGVEFQVNVDIGRGIPATELRCEFEAILLAIGAGEPRDLRVEGRELAGIHFAMDFLTAQNRCLAGDAVPDQIVATGKRVVILGGGDTGADCVGTCHRQRASSVHQFEIRPMPPASRDASTPWPMWPYELRTESSHEEGGEREWSIVTTALSGHGSVKKLHLNRAGFETQMDADLVLLAMGFTGPVRAGAIEQLGVAIDARGNVATEDYQTSIEGVFAGGDARRGQSLVVWAIAEGRAAAQAIGQYLGGV